jgi:hypothetical protein
MSKKEFENPIDKDKITENPSTLTYGHHVGSSVVKPHDMGKLKGNAMKAMEHQTDIQLTQIYEQMQLLAEQAKHINARKTISERIYGATFKFKPVINHLYYLYLNEEETEILSIIAPNEWGKKQQEKYNHVATVRLLGDHTWEIIELNE